MINSELLLISKNKSFRVKDFHPVLGTKMRFVVYVKDKAPEHILEAGIDYFYITEGPTPPPFANEHTQMNLMLKVWTPGPGLLCAVA